MSDEAASKNQLAAAGTISPPVIPERHSSKRGAAESIEELQAQRKKLAKTIRNQSKDYQETVLMMLSILFEHP